MCDSPDDTARAGAEGPATDASGAAACVVGPGPGFADALFDALGALALVVDDRGCIVRMNRAAEEFTGHSSEQACGKPYYWERFLPPEERGKVRGWYEAMHTRGIPPNPCNHWIGANGERRLLRWSNTILDGADGRPAYLIAVGSDITEQERLARVNARLASYRDFLAQVSQALSEAGSETEWLRQVCELAVRHAGVRLAWVGAPDTSLRVRMTSAAGPALGYLDGIDISVDASLPSGRGTTARCWNEQRAYFNVSFAANPMLHAWRERAERFGLQASAVLPIRRGNAMLAVLTLYSDEAGFFDTALQQLLLELAQDIERGLEHLQLRQLSKALLDHTAAGVAVVLGSRCRFANERMAQLLGHDAAAELVGLRASGALDDVSAQLRLRARLAELRRSGTLRMQAVPLRRRDGSLLWCDLTAVRLGGRRTVWTAVDVSARELQRREMEQLQRLYRALLAEGDVVLRAADEAQMLQLTCLRLVQDTPFHAAILRKPDAQGWMQTLARAGSGSELIDGLLVHVDDHHAPDAQAWRDGALVLHNDNLGAHRDSPWFAAMRGNAWESVLVVPVRRADAPWALLMFVAPVREAFHAQTLRTCEQVCELLGHGLDELDLKQRLLQLQAEEAHRARHDALTELPNRFALEHHLPQAMARATRRQTALAVGLIDLDDFKPVNDGHGHAVGDLLLRQLAQRMRELLRAGDFLARLGGDEFVLVIEDLEPHQAALQLDSTLRRLHCAVEREFDLGAGRVGRIDMSMGVALYPEHADDASALLRRADAAMYEAKAHKTLRLRWWRLAQMPVPRALASAAAEARPGIPHAG